MTGTPLAGRFFDPPQEKRRNFANTMAPSFHPEKELQRARTEYKSFRKFLRKLHRHPPRDLDGQVHQLHDEAFERVDCLACANCCKTTSPVFLEKDVERLAGTLGIRPSVFAERYLTVDEDGDHVLKSTPCPFLQEDNTCSVYEDRPRACRDFPHTDRRKIRQTLGGVMEKNALICPAVFEIVEKMKKRYSG